MSAALKQIAAIAKGLSKAELHVLIELAARAEAAEALEANASSRELAEETGLARSSVQLALDSLQRRGLIYSVTGTLSKPAVHRLLFLEAVEVQSRGPIVGPEVARTSGQGGPTLRPVVARNSVQDGLKCEPGVAQLSGQGGRNSGPLPNEKSSTCEAAHTDNASAPAKSIEKNDFDILIDRLQKAEKSDFDPAVFEQARNLIASHHAKFAREDCQTLGLPDDQITAQFLAVADWPRLSRVLYELISERKESGYSWAWYVAVALQRVHRISPEEIRARRERRRGIARSEVLKATRIDTRRPIRTPPTLNCFSSIQESCQPSGGMDKLRQQIRILAATKSI